MKINVEYLKEFVDHKYDRHQLKELLASIGIEVDEMTCVNGADVFEVEITPNRPDWLSHYGVAREIHAKNTSLRLRDIRPERKESQGNSSFKVEIKDSRGCARFSGALLKNIEVGPSSDRVRNLLESFGMRPVNNVVDISNLILMSYGHPIHIFDLDRISGNRLVIRSAEKGETLKPLAGEDKELLETDLVVADEKMPLSLAGVMGGEYSGVTESTRNIFIECAWFHPSRVRKTSKMHSMKTDASFLFERGANIDNTLEIIDLTIEQLLKETGGTVEIVDYFDEYPSPAEQQIVKLQKDYPEKLTGISIEDKVSSEILGNLGYQLEDRGDYWDVKVPFFRVDINGHEDLVEEIIRIYGYDKLDTVLPGTQSHTIEPDKRRQVADDLRSWFTANGYTEVINYSFHSPEDNSFFGEESDNVEIKNPIGADYSVLRNSMSAGLLKNTATNRNNEFRRISLFETGTIFFKKENEPAEQNVAAFSVSGYETLPNWENSRGRLFDLFLFKSQILAYLKKLGMKFTIKEAAGYSGFLKKHSSFEIWIDGESAGFIGEAADRVLEFYKNDDAVWICQLDLDILTAKKEEKDFRVWNRLPAATRDLSFLINRDIGFSSIRDAVEKFRPDELEDYSLTDLYEGKGIPGDKISMLMNFRYRSPEKTLTTEEVNDLHDTLTGKLTDELQIIRR